METTGKLVNPAIEKQKKSINKKESVISDESKFLIKKSEKQSFIIIFSYLLVSISILFFLYTSNSKHTLLLFFLQSAFFISIPFLFKGTRVLLKEALNYLYKK